MTTTTFNIATLNSTSAGIVPINSGSTIVVFNGTNLQTPNGLGIFTNLAVPLGLPVNAVAFGSGSSVTGSADFLFHDDVNVVQASGSNGQSFVFVGITGSLVTTLTGTLSSALAFPYVSGGIAGRNAADDGWVALTQWGDIGGIASSLLFGTTDVSRLKLQNSNASFELTGSTLVATGSALFPTGLSGSLTNLTDGTSYLIQGSGVTITSQSNGAVTISSINSDTEQHVTASVVTTTTTPTLLQTFTLAVSSAYSMDYKVLGVQSNLTNRGQFVRNVFSFSTSSVHAEIQNNIAAAIPDNLSDLTWNISFLANTNTVELWVTGSASPVSWSSNLNSFNLTAVPGA